MGCHLYFSMFAFLVFIPLIIPTNASAGDRSYMYQRCLRGCFDHNCSRITDEDFMTLQPFHLRMLRWDCQDECSYMCMWKTVDAYQKDNQPIQQFHGKWPFIRFLGIQEPASVVFSLLNGLSHAICLWWLRKNVTSSAPMYYVWHFYAFVGMNAWFWSVVFHTRDFPFTEKMDYFCAISLVLSSVFVLCARVLGTKEFWKPAACFAVLLAFYVYHVHYLAFVRFDYAYNMKANVTVGVLNSIAWLKWASKHRKEQPYVWKAAAVIIALNVLILLEVLDFPPFLWTFDAHSLWHAGTAPLGFLWCSFEVDDCRYLYQLDKKLSDNEEGKKSD